MPTLKRHGAASLPGVSVRSTPACPSATFRLGSRSGERGPHALEPMFAIGPAIVAIGQERAIEIEPARSHCLLGTVETRGSWFDATRQLPVNGR